MVVAVVVVMEGEVLVEGEEVVTVEEKGEAMSRGAEEVEDEDVPAVEAAVEAEVVPACTHCLALVKTTMASMTSSKVRGEKGVAVGIDSK